MQLNRGSIRRLLGYLKPYLGTLIVATILLSLAGALMSLVIATFKPLFRDVLLPAAAVSGSGEILQNPAASESPSMLDAVAQWLPLDAIWQRWKDVAYVRVPLWIAVLFLIRSICIYFGQTMAVRTGVLLVKDLRSDLYAKLVTQAPPFFREHSTGALLSRVVGDVQRIQHFAVRMLVDGVRVGAMVPFLIAVAFWHNARLSALALVVLPLLGYPTIRLARRLRKVSGRSQSRTADLSARVTETVQGIRIVQAFGGEQKEQDAFDDGLYEIARADLRAGQVSAMSPAILELLGALTAAGLFFITGRWIALGLVDRGDAFVVFAALGLLFMSVRRLNAVYVESQHAQAAAERVFALMDAPKAIEESSNPIEATPFSESLTFEHVDFAYETGPKVLDGIDLTIRKGEVVALVGASGSGKSTLAMLVPRFFDPQAGSVKLDGVDLRSLTLESLRKQIGIVSQEPVLFDATVAENIAYGEPHATREAIEAVAKAAEADGFVRKLPQGYDTRLGERGTTLSVGQRQRLTIARALLIDPPILILDEATSALDAANESKVQKALETLMAGRTTLVIAHRLATIRSADRIVVLGQGKIVEQGEHDSLLRAGGVYAQLYALQTEILDDAQKVNTGPA